MFLGSIKSFIFNSIGMILINYDIRKHLSFSEIYIILLIINFKNKIFKNVLKRVKNIRYKKDNRIITH